MIVIIFYYFIYITRFMDFKLKINQILTKNVNEFWTVD